MTGDAERERKRIYRGKYARIFDARVGRESESKVEEALKLLTNQQKITSFWHGNYQQDKKEHTDFIIQDLEGNEVPLQVKSSVNRMNVFKAQHPEIPVIAVEREDDTDLLALKIEGAALKSATKIHSK